MTNQPIHSRVIVSAAAFLVLFFGNLTPSLSFDRLSDVPWSDARKSGKTVFASGSASTYAYGDPTVAEQLYLEAINRARLNPQQESADLGIDLNEGLPAGTLPPGPRQPLTCNASLLASARNHSLDMMTNNYMEHNSLDGTTPYQRMLTAGFQYIWASENIAWVGTPGVLNEITAVAMMHEDLFIDDTLPGRGHRLNILEPAFKEMGAGIVEGPYTLYDADVILCNQSYMLTCDFGTSSNYDNSFILGVIFNDTNGDSLYSAGEGMANVVIEVFENIDLKSNTVTATAGGYALLLEPGTYTVKASLSDGNYATKSVTLGTSNVKLDFLGSDFSGWSSAEPDGGGGGGGGCFISGLVNNRPNL